MTYSHNTIKSNIKMTTAPATKTIRVKNGGCGGGGLSKTPPPSSATSSTTSTPVTAHSNSIASSTNYFSHQQSQQQQQQQPQQQHQQHALSISPPGCPMSSAASTCSSTSSLGSAGNGSGAGYFASRQRQQHQQQQQRNRQQRQSPQQQLNNGSGGGGGFFYPNNKRGGGGSGSAHKHRDSPRSPNNMVMVRQSPAIILGGGIANGTTTISINSFGSGGTGRKQRRSPLNVGSCGKISPTHAHIPTALTHFAGSKCFDAPAPTALPKPPQHWTLGKAEEKFAGNCSGSGSSSSTGPGLQHVVRGSALSAAGHAHTRSHMHVGGHVVKSSKRNLLDDFDTHNLKLLLNVHS